MGELDFDDVVFGYGGNTCSTAFPHLSRKEQISCIVGPNGCGKSTLAKLAMGRAEARFGVACLFKGATSRRWIRARERGDWACSCSSKRRP